PWPLTKKCDSDPVARKPPHRPKGHGLLPGVHGQAFSMRCDTAHRDEMSAARSAKLVAPARALGHPLGNALERGHEAHGRHERPEQPHGQVESANREDDSRATGNFENGSGFATLGRGEARDFRYVAWTLGKF